MPVTSAPPSQGWVSRSTPARARPGHASIRRSWARRAATLRGPRNSMATVVPSGMRSRAARKATVVVPVATPSASTGATTARGTSRGRGRASRSRMTAPATRRSQPVPDAPTIGNRPTDSAAPSWTDSMATTASDQAGGRAASGEPRDEREEHVPATAALLSLVVVQHDESVVHYYALCECTDRDRVHRAGSGRRAGHRPPGPRCQAGPRLDARPARREVWRQPAHGGQRGAGVDQPQHRHPAAPLRCTRHRTAGARGHG